MRRMKFANLFSLKYAVQKRTQFKIFQVCYGFESDPIEQICDRLDRQEFVEILKKMLVLNQDFRLTPLEGLEHKFVTMAHLHAYANTN
ncbi:unnamed protein product [Strongylus vulgaris]|uniref:Protein kinase domain-containing protein n=1 Tax=Strongylus vulgaris TaxID=40348 RepID=A0A3P7JB24_STRVU|nr:unnamed protein product [Strongylus vulgaris]